MNYNSGHSKIVKRAIAKTILSASLKKSCVHVSNSAFQDQVERLMNAGYPDVVISSVYESMVRKVKDKAGKTKCDEKSKRAVLPYVHKLAHGLKNVGSRYGVDVLFSAKHKIGRICPIVDKVLKDETVRGKCGVNHRNKYVACVKQVVYLIPLSCGREYVGQTKRCVNVRLREHELSL